MNINLLKQISLLSIFLGLALGVITLIPFINNLAFFILMCLSSTIIIMFLTKLQMLEIETTHQSVILGSIIGFMTFVGFSLLYIPVSIFLIKVFHLASNYGVSIFLSNASFGIMILLVIFMGILSATVNAFSGFLTYYIYGCYKSVMLNKLNGNSNNIFEVKDDDKI